MRRRYHNKLLTAVFSVSALLIFSCLENSGLGAQVVKCVRIHLKNGNKMDGVITKKTEDGVYLEMLDGTANIFLNKKDIKSVEEREIKRDAGECSNEELRKNEKTVFAQVNEVFEEFIDRVKGIFRKKSSMILAVKGNAKTESSLSIEINTPREFDFMKKAEVYDIRKEAVAQYRGLLKDDAEYEPSGAVFGQIVDGKPWWGLLGQCCYGNGQRSIAGASEESRFVLNPFLLAGMTDISARQITGGPENPRPIYPKPYSLTWKPKEAFAEIRYNITEYWDAYGYHYGVSPQRLESFTLVVYNARDFGLSYMYIDLAESKNVTPHNHTENAVFINQFIHSGGSCGYPGGCNNMSPQNPSYDIKVTRVPAKVCVKFWSQDPRDVTKDPEMTFVVEMI